MLTDIRCAARMIPTSLCIFATERHQLNRPMMRRQMILVIFCLEVDTKVFTYVVMHFVSGINVMYWMGVLISRSSEQFSYM